LIVILLGQLMAEKPFFDADQSVAKYRLQQLSSDLAEYPYLAIWKGIDVIRTESERRGFPETAEILKEVKGWTEYISRPFEFFAIDKFADGATVETRQQQPMED
jgi:hypothetical protein